MSNDIANAMFEFIECARCADNEEAILKGLTVSASFFGIEMFAISGIPKANERIDPYFIGHQWPVGWFERYLSQNYVHADPVIRRSLRTDDMFLWSETVCNDDMPSQSKLVMDEAAEYGMRDGLSVPIHAAEGMQGIVSFAGRKIELPLEHRNALHVIAIYAHNYLRNLIKRKARVAPRVSIALTPRERECIAWCADGKTDWEIGQILDRSERTIRHLIDNAASKLEAVNRPQAVAEAFRQGILKL